MPIGKDAQSGWPLLALVEERLARRHRSRAMLLHGVQAPHQEVEVDVT